MTLDMLIMFLGAFVALLPFLGFPTSWDTVFLFLAGTVIIVLGIIVRRERNSGKEYERQGDLFAESGPRTEA